MAYAQKSQKWKHGPNIEKPITLGCLSTPTAWAASYTVQSCSHIYDLDLGTENSAHVLAGMVHTLLVYIDLLH